MILNLLNWIKILLDMKKNFVFYGILITLIVIFIASAIIFKVYQIEILPSQFYGALIGVFITAIVTAFLLRGQTEGEVQKDKDVKIFKQKIVVYSEFTSKMWKMVYDVESDARELEKKYDEIKLFCFDKLVFFLKEDETKNLTEIIEKIDTTQPTDYNLPHICKITNILQNSLEIKHKNESSLKNLYYAFGKRNIESKGEKKIDYVEEKENNIFNEQQLSMQNITFWHFNILQEEQQIKAFKQGNWVLALIEDGEEWRTNSIKQIKPNDVIFLFKRGGTGYIGVFKALDPQYKILKKGETYSDIEYLKYDIYEGIKEGYSLASNILVEPIAYNFKGVGYYTVRRRTIERMNDLEAVKFLLNRFNGKDLDENQLAGKGKLDNETLVKLNDDYFSEIAKQNNL